MSDESVTRDFMDFLGKTGNKAAKDMSCPMSYQDILGEMTRHFAANMPMVDLNRGSVINSMIEALSHQVYQQNVTINELAKRITELEAKDEE